MLAHEYDKVIEDARRQLTLNPEDRAAIGWMSDALRAKGDYREALRCFERLSALHKEDNVARVLAPGSEPYRIEIACLHWLLGDLSTAISQMHGLAAGILDSSIKYGDAAGGMKQGLLLYYMGITAKNADEASYALDYLKKRIWRLRKLLASPASRIWPTPIAQYLIGDIAFESVLEEVERKPKLAVPDAAERIAKGRRFNLAETMFYDGVKSRAEGDESRCLSRMRESYLPESQSNESFFARNEIKQAGQDAELA